MAKPPVYTIEAGRWILRGGKPFISIHRGDNCSPVDADEVATFICMCLNEKRYTVNDPDFPNFSQKGGKA